MRHSLLRDRTAKTHSHTAAAVSMNIPTYCAFAGVAEDFSLFYRATHVLYSTVAAPEREYTARSFPGL